MGCLAAAVLNAEYGDILPAVLAEIRTYDVVIWLHVAAVIVGFGATFGYAFFQAVAERTNPRAIPTVMRATGTADRFLVIPSVLVVFAAGVYLVLDGPFDWEDTFVSVGLAGWLVLFVLGLTFFPRFEKKLIELAERDIAAAGSGEVELSDEYWAASQRIALVGSLSGVIILAVAFFMIYKP